MEPARRLLGLPLARPRGLLRDRRLRDRDPVHAHRRGGRVQAVPGPARSSGVAVALLSVPIGWVALRVRAATFAIVTISLLFVVQQLAFNLHGLTNGSQGLALPFPHFAPATYERPFYWAMLAVFAALGARVLVRARLQARAHAPHRPRRRGSRPRGGGRRHHGQGHRLRRQRRAHGDDRRHLGLLHLLHLPAVRRRPAGHDRRGAHGLPGRQGHDLGAGARRLHPRARPAVPRLQARGVPAVPRRLRERLPGHHAAPAARHPALDRGPPRPPARGPPRARRRRARRPRRARSRWSHDARCSRSRGWPSASEA